MLWLLDCQGQTKLSTFEGDIRDSELLRKVCKGASIIVHTASLIDVTGALNYSELYGVNVKGNGLFVDLSCVLYLFMGLL